MSNIDEELKQAIRESEQSDATQDTQGHDNGIGASASSVDEGSDEGDGSSRRSLGVLITLLVLGGGILSFVLGQDSKQLTYAKDVQSVLANQEELAERNLRVQGVLVPGTLSKRDEPCEYRFKIRQMGDHDGQVMDVRYASCIVPDTFRDVPGIDVEATVTGQMAEGYFQARDIQAKCPSKYEMEQRQLAGEQKPHGTVEGDDPDLGGAMPIGEGS